MNKYLNKNIINLIISFIIGGLFMYFLLRFTPLVNSLLNKDGNYVIVKDETKVYEKNSLGRAVDKIYDSVVYIERKSNAVGNNNGSGFIYKVDDKYAYIITNEHVITGGSNILITLSTDEVIEAEVLGKDAYLDLAILKIEKKGLKQVANIGSSEKAHLGDTIFTVGTPLNSAYRGSVTAGILSGKDRMVQVSVSDSDNNDWVLRVLQIDASINPGNSGGPLLNASGEVIGICSMKLVNDNVEGMAFAIPIEYAMAHIDTLEKGKEIKWPSIGIDVVNVTDSTSLLNNDIPIPNNIEDGVVITNVNKKTAASKAKLKKGDIITKLDNKNIKDTSYLRYELYQHKAGDIVKLTIKRNSKEKIVSIKLDEK